MTIRIFAVDDSDVFIDAATKFFDSFPEQYQLIGSYGAVQDEDGVEDLVDTIQIQKPDIVLMDFGFQLVNRPRDFGVELTRQIIKRIPHQKIIVLTTETPFVNPEVYDWVKRAFQAGALAYLLKGELHTWLECIKEVHHSKLAQFGDQSSLQQTDPNDVSIPKSVIETMKERLKQAGTFKLTDRQLEAVKLLAADLKGDEIAKEMKISHGSVMDHLDNAKVKFGVKTLPGLIAVAMRHGVIF